ncbi:VOC family protein [Streptomyces sp. CC210A]|uniref:VOC family protein n=1 Tax=Streptomyces sp. CC210A TaxID=2898184 RepID=UPI001F372768|nr:VOC family protein [Streptomyces sp. CC210A]
MAGMPEGTPCWVDAMFTDLEGAKSFYGDVLGWTFGEASAEYGNYTQAYADGKAVAAIVPPMPGQEGGAPQSAWCLYFASPDVEDAARRVRDNGGEVVMGPMQVGDFGSMLLVREPSGATFGVWQAGRHKGFEASPPAPGTYCWAELYTRDADAADGFLRSLFPYTVKQMDDDRMDFRTFAIGDDMVLGRMKMDADFPPEIPPYINVYFTVEDVDAALDRATARGAKVLFGPVDSPFGRFAALMDPQGAAFSLIDVARTEGEAPAMTEVS